MWFIFQRPRHAKRLYFTVLCSEDQELKFRLRKSSVKRQSEEKEKDLYEGTETLKQQPGESLDGPGKGFSEPG